MSLNLSAVHWLYNRPFPNCRTSLGGQLAVPDLEGHDFRSSEALDEYRIANSPIEFIPATRRTKPADRDRVLARQLAPHGGLDGLGYAGRFVGRHRRALAGPRPTG